MGKVLLIDDDRQIRRVVRLMLERLGHIVVEASDGIEALRIFPEVKPDVTLLDLNMPGRNGFAILADLRAFATTARVVLMTGSCATDENLVEVLVRDPYVAHLSKPFIGDSLSAAIRAAIDAGGA